jgi:hypothetical protein
MISSYLIDLFTVANIWESLVYQYYCTVFNYQGKRKRLK